jgi:type III pantothenate kinase
MRHPSAGDDGGGHLSGSGEPPRWLLVGSSRWHLAERAGDEVHFHHGLAESFRLPAPPVAWAAVGVAPPVGPLPPQSRVLLEQVPLREAPPWLGIDRALAGWEAWRQARRPVLVADAGTIVSFTLVDEEGRFRGGRLLPGLALQLRSMAGAAEALPLLEPPWSEQQFLPADPPWPRPTAAAMLSGVGAGVAAAIEDCLTAVEAVLPSVQLVLTGGDAELLQRMLADHPRMAPRRWRLRPWLCLESLMRLRPAEGVCVSRSPGR